MTESGLAKGEIQNSTQTRFLIGMKRTETQSTGLYGSWGGVGSIDLLRQCTLLPYEGPCWDWVKPGLSGPQKSRGQTSLQTKRTI